MYIICFRARVCVLTLHKLLSNSFFQQNNEGFHRLTFNSLKLFVWLQMKRFTCLFWSRKRSGHISFWYCSIINKKKARWIKMPNWVWYQLLTLCSFLLDFSFCPQTWFDRLDWLDHALRQRNMITTYLGVDKDKIRGHHRALSNSGFPQLPLGKSYSLHLSKAAET